MRSMSFLITASVLSTIFIGIALMSAVITRTVHKQLSSRSTPVIMMQN